MNEKEFIFEEQITRLSEASRIFVNNYYNLIGQVEFPSFYFSEIQFFDEFKKTIENICEIFDSLKNSYQKFRFEGVQKTILQASETLMTIEKTNWWITPSLIEYDNDIIQILFKTMNIYKNGNNDAFNDFFINVYQTNNAQYLKRVVKKWGKNYLFNPWMNIIKDALYAHCKAKYNLSIPALLLVAEGIATEYCKKHYIDIKKYESQGNNKIKLALAKDYIEKHINSYNKINTENTVEIINIVTETSLILHGLFFAINDIIYLNTNKFKEKNLSYDSNLNRHAIIHGITKDYGTLTNSLKCFMLLDSLSILEKKEFYLYF